MESYKDLQALESELEDKIAATKVNIQFNIEMLGKIKKRLLDIKANLESSLAHKKTLKNTTVLSLKAYKTVNAHLHKVVEGLRLSEAQIGNTLIEIETYKESLRDFEAQLKDCKKKLASFGILVPFKRRNGPIRNEE